MQKIAQIKTTKKAQVLVIVLLVMMVLGIMIVSITGIIIENSQQSSQNTQYEEQYATAEKHILNIAQSMPMSQNLGDPNDLKNTLKTIFDETGIFLNTSQSDYFNPLNDCDADTSGNLYPGEVGVICSFTDQTSSTADRDDVIVTFEAINSPNIVDALVHKDESIAFMFDSTNPPNPGEVFTISVAGDGVAAGNLAIEVIFDFRYTDKMGAIQSTSVRGVFEIGDLFNPDVDNLFFKGLSTGTTSASIDYDDLEANILSEYTSSFIDTSLSIIPLQFRFKPIINTTDSSSVLLTVTRNDPPAGSLVQSRRYEATVYSTIEGQSELFGAQAFAQASIPSFKIPGVFDYILRSKSTIEHETP